MTETVSETPKDEEAKVNEVDAQESATKVKEAEVVDEANEKKEKKDEQSKEEDFKAKFYYMAAEMENLRKRFEREKENIVKYGSEKVLSGLLDVVDNLDRTLSAIESDTEEKVKNIFTGINMVKTQFVDVLKQNGVEEVEAKGKMFDPNFHEAMAQQPNDDVEEGTVLDVFQAGYLLNGRLIRPAKVIVAKKS